MTVQRNFSDLLARQAKLLTSAGLRSTPARIGVLAVLESVLPNCLQGHQILRELGRRSGAETVGSTYRAMKELQRSGLLICSWNEKGKMLYRLRPDGQASRVNILVCQCAQRPVVIEDRVLLERLTWLAVHEGFAVPDQPVFTISMICAGCEHKRGSK